MARIDPSWIGKVMTVEGLIPSEDLGITLPHEHLRVQEWDQQSPRFQHLLYEELLQYPLAGGRTVVEVSPIGMPRDFVFLRRLGRQTGVQVVVCTGFYKAGWHPSWLKDASVEAITEIMIGQIVDGVEDTGIHAGVLKVAVSHPISSEEQRVLAAIGRAQQATGAGVQVHLDVFMPPNDYRQTIDIIEREGGDLRRVSLCHFVARPDWLEFWQEITARGCFIEFELWGHERWPLLEDMMHTDPEVQYSSIKGLLNHGLLNHILLSHDICNMHQWTVNGGYGYAHLLRTVVPKLRGYGVTEADIQTLIVENPRRLLAFNPSLQIE